MQQPLVQKVKASGILHKQIKPPTQKPAKFTMKRTIASADTKKGASRAFVSKDSMPVSIEPIKTPRSKTLSQIGRSIRRA